MPNLDLKSLIGKLNQPCRSALEAAAGLCLSRTHYDVDLEHVFLKFCETNSVDVTRILQHFKINTARLQQDLVRSLDRLKTGNGRTPALSPRIPEMMQEAWALASINFSAEQIRSGHLLLALLSSANLARMAKEISSEFSLISTETLQARFFEIVAGSEEEHAESPGHIGEQSSAKTGTPALQQFTIDLTAQAQKGEIDPVLGRDFEIRQVIDILTRRRQNNPILVGEAGVGKTAVVEGFALRVVQGEVPPALAKVSIRTLDLGLLQAGAGVKGEFENRLKSVIAEVKASAQPIILFIDEAHTLIGAGGQAGQGDAANLLKPALARGELRTIAATTWAEYKKYFEKDAALARRFQPIKVEEPSEAQAIAMMRGLVAALEKHHRVRILDEAVAEAVRQSHRYISGRQLPDKCVSVLDTACARVAIAQTATPEVMEDCQRQIEEHAANHDPAKKDHQQPVAKPAANGNHKAELHGAAEKLKAIQGETPLVHPYVNSGIVAEVISGWTGIPVGKMVKNEIQTVMNLQELLEKRIIGQPHALEALSQRLCTAKAGLEDPNKPVGVFLLAGPSGTGKTLTALSLADILYGGERNLVTINMSEYKESHSVSGLKGSPPGYVGYGEGGVLTEAVRRKPYCVLLLDEIEKAHRDVHELFYQVFDKGVMEDAEGREINFKNTVILLTSNVGTDTIMQLCADKKTRPDPEELAASLRPDLLKVFKPAFLGRLIVVPYYPIADDVMTAIVTLQLDKIRKRLAENQRIEFSYEEAVVDAIAARCTEVESGGRNVDHILTRTLLPEISKEVLARMGEGKTIAAIRITARNSGDFEYQIT